MGTIYKLQGNKVGIGAGHEVFGVLLGQGLYRCSRCKLLMGVEKGFTWFPISRKCPMCKRWIWFTRERIEHGPEHP
tara:strand:+ start:289 stop:516 length:228 start_codon:yes stop_codon:yes gene_type:complete